MRKSSQKKLGLVRETLETLQGIAGGGFTDFCGDTVIDDTVWRPQPSETCSRGCPILA